MCLLSNKKERKEYFKKLSINPFFINGSHDSSKEIRGDLGLFMKKLKNTEVFGPFFYLRFDYGEKEIENFLEKLHNILELDNLDNFKKQYKKYLLLLSIRKDIIEVSQNNKYWMKLVDIPDLKKNQWNYWGSIKQLQYGKVVVDVLNEYYKYNLHPIWGCLLNPTGGIVGAGNNELINSKWNSYISLHGCVHDASGYLYQYHKIGKNGYNYLGTKWTLFFKSSPYCCQIAGLRYWKKLCN
jgi:hypothetical protein